MATCLQVPMVPFSLRSSSSSSSTTSSFDSSSCSSSMYQKIEWRYNRNVSKRLNYRCSSARVPLPPINPDDPFIKTLASFAEANPTLGPSSDSDLPPYLDLFTQSTMSQSAQPTMSQSAQGARLSGSGSYGQHKSRRPPPDVPSLLLDGRIVFLGMPMVPAVTELVIAEFMYLQWVDDTAPIYLYINSTGTSRDDDEVVAHDSEGFAIYDAMMQIRNDVETIAVGACVGHACLLLAAGKEGRRFMFPNGRVAMKAPYVAASGLMQASDVFIHTKEAIAYRDMLHKLFAFHTGHRLKDIEKKLKKPWYMGAREALEFGVVDKILFQGQEEVMGDILTPEQWEEQLRGKNLDDTSHQKKRAVR